MVDLTKTYISQAIYVVGHNLDTRIRYQQEAAENAFKSFISAQSQQTNLPDEFDPTSPRLIFQAPKKQLLISQVSTQLVLNFNSREKTLSEQIEIIIKNVKEAHEKIQSFKASTELKENALVLSVNFPSSLSKSEMSAQIYTKCLRLDPLGEIASTSLKVGYETKENLYLNTELDVYEMRHAEFNQPVALNSINILDIPVTEQGYTLKIDINSKPKLRNPQYINNGPDEIIKVTEDFMSSKLNTLMSFTES